MYIEYINLNDLSECFHTFWQRPRSWISRNGTKEKGAGFHHFGDQEKLEDLIIYLINILSFNI